MSDLVHDLIAAAHPFGSREKATLVLTVYLDESYNSQERDAYTVAGFLSVAKRWDKFSRDWSKVLKDIGIKVFHMADFESRYGEFKDKDWSKERRIAILSRLVNIIEHRVEFGCSASVLLQDYERVLVPVLPPQVEPQRVGEPFIFCMQNCLELFRDYERPKGERIAVFFERNQHSGKAVAHFEKLREDYPSWREAFVSMTPIDKADFVPLQSADMLAYETCKHVRNQFVPGVPPRPERGLLTALAKTEKITAGYHNADSLASSIAKIKAAGQWH